MQRLILLILLSCALYAVAPAAAQRAPDRARILEDVRETDRAAMESARDWSMEHRIPRRIPQRDGRIVELVGIDGNRPRYYASTNSTSSAITGTVHLYPGERLGLSLTGQGMEIGIWDGGHVYRDHRELSGRVTYGDEAEVTDHATHVAGTLSATGVDARARGMAFQSTLRSYSWTNDATEMTNEASAGLLLSNHSYTLIAGWYYGDLEDRGDTWYWMGDPFISSTEDYAFGWYDVGAVQFDRAAYTNPYYLPVVAAGNERIDTGPSSGSYRAMDDLGNFKTYTIEQRPIPPDGSPDGFDTISGAGVAKNVLTVGSIAGSPGSPSFRISRFSSFGPTDDGRIKPDIMGVGENVYSLASDDRSSYGISSGTSMATPNVTGSLALLQQYYQELFGEYMRAATLKGLVLHTALDLGTPGPDYRTGWGLLDTEAAAEHITHTLTNPIGIIEAELENGSVYEKTINVSAPGPLHVTLSWTDPPSARLARRGPEALDAPDAHLRNDLDLRLTRDGTGDVYAPYVLDRLRPDAPAVTGDNTVDPIEQIFIASADTGMYTVTVSHKRALVSGSEQAFSLIVTGAEDITTPVAIAHLQTDASLEGITLYWTTLFERTAGRFEVERAPFRLDKSATDDFVKVGEISVSGRGGHDYEFTDEQTLAGRYNYRIVHVAGDDRFVAAQTQVNLPAPDSYAFVTSYPNPFQQTTVLVLDLPKTQRLRLEVYDVLGRRIELLHDGDLGAGRHRLEIDGGSWPSGVYFARVSTPNGVVVHKLIRQ